MKPGDGLAMPDKKPSELARSLFWKQVYTLQEDTKERPPLFGDLDDRLADLIEKVNALKSDCEEKFESLHDNFKDSSKLPDRIEALEECVTRLEEIDTDYDGPDDDLKQAEWTDERWLDAVEALNNISCD